MGKPCGLGQTARGAVGRWRFGSLHWEMERNSSRQNATPSDQPVRRPGQFAQTVTEKLMTYALGRSVEYYDMPAVRAIVRDAARDNYRFSAIVMGIVRSAPFQMRKASEEGLSPKP